MCIRAGQVDEVGIKYTSVSVVAKVFDNGVKLSWCHAVQKSVL